MSKKYNGVFDDFDDIEDNEDSNEVNVSNHDARERNEFSTADDFDSFDDIDDETSSNANASVDDDTEDKDDLSVSADDFDNFDDVSNTDDSSEADGDEGSDSEASNDDDGNSNAEKNDDPYSVDHLLSVALGIVKPPYKMEIKRDGNKTQVDIKEKTPIKTTVVSIIILAIEIIVIIFLIFAVVRLNNQQSKFKNQTVGGSAIKTSQASGDAKASEDETDSTDHFMDGFEEARKEDEERAEKKASSPVAGVFNVILPSKENFDKYDKDVENERSIVYTNYVAGIYNSYFSFSFKEYLKEIGAKNISFHNEVSYLGWLDQVMSFKLDDTNFRITTRLSNGGDDTVAASSWIVAEKDGKYFGTIASSGNGYIVGNDEPFSADPEIIDQLGVITTHSLYDLDCPFEGTDIEHYELMSDGFESFAGESNDDTILHEDNDK